MQEKGKKNSIGCILSLVLSKSNQCPLSFAFAPMTSLPEAIFDVWQFQPDFNYDATISNATFCLKRSDPFGQRYGS